MIANVRAATRPASSGVFGAGWNSAPNARGAGR